MGTLRKWDAFHPTRRIYRNRRYLCLNLAFPKDANSPRCSGQDCYNGADCRHAPSLPIFETRITDGQNGRRSDKSNFFVAMLELGWYVRH
jgi:hypothetical protein